MGEVRWNLLVLIFCGLFIFLRNSSVCFFGAYVFIPIRYRLRIQNFHNFCAVFFNAFSSEFNPVYIKIRICFLWSLICLLFHGSHFYCRPPLAHPLSPKSLCFHVAFTWRRAAVFTESSRVVIWSGRGFLDFLVTLPCLCNFHSLIKAKRISHRRVPLSIFVAAAALASTLATCRFSLALVRVACVPSRYSELPPAPSHSRVFFAVRIHIFLSTPNPRIPIVWAPKILFSLFIFIFLWIT